MPFITPRIREAYEDLGLSRAEFAAVTGIAPRTLTNLVSNGAPCSRSRAVRIAKALGWELADVLTEERAA